MLPLPVLSRKIENFSDFFFCYRCVNHICLFFVSDDFSRPVRRKKPIADPNPDPRFPINNEIPDSANVQANEGPNADVPLSAIQNESKSRQQQLNLGKFLT